MKLRCGVLLCIFAMTVLPFMSPQTGWEQDSIEESKQEILAVENHWLSVEDDPAALDAILAADFRYVVPVGIITKNEQLYFIRKHPSPKRGTKHFADIRVRIYGDVGIVNGAVVATSSEGTHKTFFTDVFVRREGRWRQSTRKNYPPPE
jgi:hypothetical protein